MRQRRSCAPLPFFGRERLDRERVDLFAHAVAQRRVHELMLRTCGIARETAALTMTASKCVPSPENLDVLAVEALLDVLLDETWIHGFQWRSL